MGFEREAARDGPMVAGRYALYDKIATGGMATVHLGRLLGPIGFSRTVAIKRMLPQFVSDLGFVSMFVDEARLASRIRHPNVVPTLDVVAQDRKSTRLNSSHPSISYAVFCLKKKNPDIKAARVCEKRDGVDKPH